MKRKILILLIALCCFGFVGCSNKEKLANTMTVILEGNPTTGYEWTAIVKDKDIVKITKSEYTPDENAENLVGVGGKYTFEFEALKEGKTTITFEYKRSWETENPLYKTTYNITVDKDLNITYEAQMCGSTAMCEFEPAPIVK